MKQDEIIEMARQAGWSGIYTQWAEPTGEADWSPYKVSLTVPVTMEQIEALIKLAAAKEREECAKVCEDGLNIATCLNALDDMEMWGEKFAKAIRARGQA